MVDRKGRPLVTKVSVNHGKYNGMMNTKNLLSIALGIIEKVRQVLHVAKTRDS